MTMRAWLSEHVLRVVADPVIFERGRAYADGGAVDLAAVRDGHVTATVHGGVPYTVELADQEGVLAWSCTCPYAEDGSFCKHLVAAGWLPPRRPAIRLRPPRTAAWSATPRCAPG